MSTNSRNNKQSDNFYPN